MNGVELTIGVFIGLVQLGILLYLLSLLRRTAEAAEHISVTLDRVLFERAEPREDD